MLGDGSLERLKREGRIVVVGASLAGLRAAETLRAEGFAGSLTLIGDEPHEPYDRPPLSKQVLLGRAAADRTGLPRRRSVDATWRLGVPATGLDMAAGRVLLADGDEVPYDRLLIATGVRARPWPREAEAELDGVFVLRTRDDSAALARRLEAGPSGCWSSAPGSPVRRSPPPAANAACRSPSPSAARRPWSALSAGWSARSPPRCSASTVWTCAAGSWSPLWRASSGRVRAAHLSDGTTVETDVWSSRSAPSATPNGSPDPDWGQGPAASPATPAAAPSTSAESSPTTSIVAGDVARCPHPLFGYQFLSLEHWGNAVAQARVAAHNMVSESTDRIPHMEVPAFWSSQFGVNIKSVGVPSLGTEVLIAQGSLKDHRFIGVYGYQGRVIAAVAFDQARWLAFYQRADRDRRAVPAAVPHGRPVLGRTAAGRRRLPRPVGPHPRSDRDPQRILAGRPSDHVHPRGTDPHGHEDSP